MALTRDFKETIQARVKSDPKFRRSLFVEAMELYISGDVETGTLSFGIISTRPLALKSLLSRRTNLRKALCVCSAARATHERETSLALSHTFERKRGFT